MSFVLRRADGSSRNVSGYLHAPPPASAKVFSRALASGSSVAEKGLPPSVDLREFMTAVENQQTTSSCAANAAAGAYEYLMKRHLGESSYDVSRLFIYYNARAAEGGSIEDQGSKLSLLIESLKQQGACSEQSWPFDPATVNDAPVDEAYSEAQQFLIEDTFLIPTELDAWKAALADGHPIIFGIALFESFDKQKKKGLVPAPSPTETGRASHGGHAMLCVGYNDKDQVFIVRNSWGTEWGDKGYCYIPYRYMMDPELNYGDSWIIKRVDVLPEGEAEAGWGDDEAVLDDAGTAIGQMSDDEWTALVDAMGDYPFEQRLAALFVRVAATDGNVDENELGVAAGHLAPVYAALGVELDAEKVLSHAWELAQDDGFIDQSVALLGQHLPVDTLASIANQLDEIAQADGELGEEEDAFVAQVIQAWQIAE